MFCKKLSNYRPVRSLDGCKYLIPEPFPGSLGTKFIRHSHHRSVIDIATLVTKNVRPIWLPSLIG